MFYADILLPAVDILNGLNVFRHVGITAAYNNDLVRFADKGLPMALVSIEKATWRTLPIDPLVLSGELLIQVIILAQNTTPAYDFFELVNQAVSALHNVSTPVGPVYQLVQEQGNNGNKSHHMHVLGLYIKVQRTV